MNWGLVVGEMRDEAYGHGFEAWGVYFPGDVFLVDQGVGFREVGGAAFGREVGHQPKIVGLPVLAPERAHHVNHVAVLEAEPCQVFGCTRINRRPLEMPPYRSSSP